MLQGLEPLKEMVGGYVTAFPDMKMTVEHIVAEGDWVAAHWWVRGTHTGPLGELPATGRSIDIRGHIVSRFDDGRIVEEWEVFDEMAMHRQLSLLDE